MNYSEPIRLAGTALQNFFSNPNTIKGIGKRVLAETAINTAAQQVVPRLMGKRPEYNIPQSLLNTGVQAAIATPLAGGMQTLGVPEWAAQTGSQMVASPAAYAITNAIIPETHNQEHSNSHELMQMQQMHAELEQQRYNNEINLALAKNYHAPTEIVHRNPSADLQTAYNIMTPNVSY